MVVPLTAFFVALGLEWTSWGQGRFNWGPRLGAILMIVMGQVAFAGTLIGDWLRTGIHWVAGWADVGVTYVLGTNAGDAVGYLVTWLPAALLGAYWLAAMLLDRWFKERMTWRLAWLGLFLPAFISAIPGPAGNFLSAIVAGAAAIGTTIISAMFALGGKVIP